jgi:ubiquinone/menaquinone biosynthesis C-methylase UbiE
MNSTFDFGEIAREYDDWYNTEAGQKIDEIEKRTFLKYLEKISTRHIVEIGAGTGHWTSFFAEKGYCVTAMDVSDKMIEVALSKDIPDSVFFRGDAINLPFPDNSVDAVVAVTSIEFVPDRNKAIEEIKRILKPDGYFVIGTLNLKGSFSAVRKNSPVFAGANFYTYRSLVEDLMKIGFPVVEGCLLMPNPEESDPERIEQIEMKADPRELNEKGNFLVGFVKKENL